MSETFRVGGRLVGRGEPVFVIAEAGVNHNGDVAMAKKLVDIAAEAKADAVKFQTFRAEELATAEAPKAEYQQKAGDANESQLEMLRRLELSHENFRDLSDYCCQKGILFLSTAFDVASADFLDSIEMVAFKIPSGEITNTLLLEHIARKNKPLFVSTGMSDLGDVEEALVAVNSSGCRDVALLHCVSNYPAAAEDINLRAMLTMEQAFGVPVGYSDHTLGIDIPLAAVALGACIIEKHFTIDRSLPGPDHAASLDPSELASMIAGIRTVEKALGDGRKRPTVAEAGTAAVARRSLVAARDIAVGEPLTNEMIAARRPGVGLPPSLQRYLVGRIAKIELKRNDMLSFDMFT
jgi:N-acetylneuraminate synthase